MNALREDARGAGLGSKRAALSLHILQIRQTNLIRFVSVVYSTPKASCRFLTCQCLG